MKNQNIVNALVNEDTYLYCLLFLKNFENESIVMNTIKIMRASLLNRKSYGEFLLKLVEFYEMLLHDDTNKLDEINVYQLFINDMIVLIDKNINCCEISVEILLLICYLTGQGNKEFKFELEKSESFISLISKLTYLYKDDDKSKKILSQTIAHLPIEELHYNTEV